MKWSLSDPVVHTLYSSASFIVRFLHFIFQHFYLEQSALSPLRVLFQYRCQAEIIREVRVLRYGRLEEPRVPAPVSEGLSLADLDVPEYLEV